MANRLKKKAEIPPPPDPEQILEDKEEEVTVKEIVKDERTYKMGGAVSLLTTLFLFVAFSSYFFTWQDDQDKIHQFGIKIFSVDDVRVNNLLGVLGAYVSHLIIYKGFGIASYLFCTFFFVLGVNLLFGKKIFSIYRNLRYLIVGLVVLSVSFSFFTNGSAFPFGGAAGDLMEAWLVKWIGKTGTGLTLVLAALFYVIWRFNPTFKWPEFTPKPKPVKSSVTNEEEEENKSVPPIIPTNFNTEEQEPVISSEALQPQEFTSSNKLKSDAKDIVLQIKEMAAEENPLNEFGVIEKEAISEPPVAIMEEPIAMQEPEIVIEPEQASVVIIPPKEEPVIVHTPPPAPVAKQQPQPVTENKFEEVELEITETSEQEADELMSAIENLAPYEPTLDLKDYKYPVLDLLEAHGSDKIVHDASELENHKNQIVATLNNYDISIQRITATVGPTVTLYEIVPSPGVRISRIKNLEDDIALSLSALGIRIIAPIPGKGTIGIEVPNVRKTVVSMRTLLASEKFQNSSFSLPIAIGKKIDNENFIVDLASMPHLLMAGATGQGKSVGINALLVSLLYKKHPSQLKFVLVDPKKVELSIYRVIEKHFLAKLPGEDEAIITDTKKVINTLNALCIEMDNRYDLLKEAHCRNIKEYNEKFIKRKLNPQKGHQFLPFIVLVVDEFADLIMTAGKEVEMPIARLAQLARAVGIHLIIATQRPSVNIITGTIKANFPARIAFKVSSKIDSRTILDAGGAEQLIGKGDMLISYNGEITRLQCAFVDTPEVDKVVDFIGNQRGYPSAFNLPEYIDEKDADAREFDLSDRDPLFNDAAKLIVQNQMGSTSLIQRRMKLGYNRAGRLMDQLEAAGIVGPNLGSKAREVMVKTDAELEEILNSL